MIVVVEELGGQDEYSLVEALKSGKITKHALGLTCTRLFKSEVQFGHTWQPQRERIMKNQKKGYIVVVCQSLVLSGDDVVKDTCCGHCNEDKCKQEVFGLASKQKDLHDQVVSLIAKEALEGYSLTIFAYGQTGIRKTTMEGEGGKQRLQ